MDAELKERFFLAGQESPGGWLFQALSLQAAAARLDWKEAPARDEELTVSFQSEYQMLLGLAFENLLKGFILLVRLEKGESPSLPAECHMHKLEKLAQRSECAGLVLSVEDVQLLSRLSPCIEWAGRYPLPKKAKDMHYAGVSNYERDAELRLWQRLVPLLQERAWVMKGGPASMGGFRLYMDGRMVR